MESSLLGLTLLCLWSVLRGLSKSEKTKLLVWLRYTGDIFFIWLALEDKLDGFLGRFIKFNPTVKLTYKKLDKEINFVDAIIEIQDDELVTGLFWETVGGNL